MLWPAGGGALGLRHFTPSRSETWTRAREQVAGSEAPAPSEFHSLRFNSSVFLPGCRYKFCPHLKASAACSGRHNRISVFVWGSRLSHSSPHSQPFLYLGGCYREGRWLITINRTERESEWVSECLSERVSEWVSEGAMHIDRQDHAAQNQGARRPLLGERRDSFMATQSWFPHPTSRPFRSVLWGLSLKSDRSAGGADGRWAPPFLQLEGGNAVTVGPGGT